MAFARATALAGSGTVSCAGTTTVTGTGTNFGVNPRLGGTIIVGGVTKTVTAINSTTSLTVDTAFGSFTNQAFTYQKEVIHTGADTMGTGLGQITGFVVTNRGDQQRIFDIGGQDLSLEGSTLTIDATTGQLRNNSFNSGLWVKSSASASAELKITGRKASAANAPFPYAGLDWLGVNGSKIMQLQGSAAFPAKLTLLDACIRYGADWITTNSGQYSEIKTEGEICWILNGHGTGTGQARLRLDNTTPSINFTAKKTYVGVWLNFGVPQVSLKGYTPLNTDGPEVNLNSVAVATRIPIEDYDTTYVVPNYYANSQIVLYGGAWLRLINNLKGTNMNYYSQNAGATTVNTLEFSKKIKATAQDSAGNLLSGGKLYYQPVGANVANIKPKGITTGITFDLSQQVATFVDGVATSEFVYAWGYAPTSGVKTTYDYFCTGTTKGAETHMVYSSTYGYDKQPALVALAGNGEATETFVHASLPTTDKVVVNAAAITGFTFNFATKTWTHALGSTRTVQEMYDAYQYQLNQLANLQQPNDCVVSGKQFNWVGWTGINNGTITAGTGGLELASDTITNAGTISAIYQSSDGKTSNIKFTALVGSTIYVTDASGVQKDLQFDKTGSYVTYAPIASSGQWKAVIERYGYQRQSFVIDITGGGEFSVTPTYIPDATIIQSSLVTVSGYTTLNTPNEEYDYSCYMRTIQPQYYFMTKDGSAVDLGSANHDIDATAAQVWSYNGSKLITKSSNLARGSTLFEEHTTGLISTLNGATISIPFKDALGLRGSVTGLDPQGFGITWYLRYKLTSASTWTYLSGTGNSASILLASGTYELQVRAAGYDWAIKSLDTSVSLTVDMGLVFHLSKDNSTPQYTKTYDAVISALLDFNAVNQAVAVTNTTSSIITASFNDVYQSLQRILHLPQLVWTWTSPVKAISISGTFSIPADNPVQFYLTADSTNSFKLSCPVVHEDTGASADDRVSGNAIGKGIILGSPASAESAGIAQTIIDRLGGTGFTTDIHSLNKIKSKVNAIFNNQ